MAIAGGPADSGGTPAGGAGTGAVGKTGVANCVVQSRGLALAPRLKEIRSAGPERCDEPLGIAAGEVGSLKLMRGGVGCCANAGDPGGAVEMAAGGGMRTAAGGGVGTAAGGGMSTTGGAPGTPPPAIAAGRGAGKEGCGGGANDCCCGGARACVGAG